MIQSCQEIFPNDLINEEKNHKERKEEIRLLTDLLNHIKVCR